MPIQLLPPNAGDQAIAHIMRRVQKGSLRGLRVERSVSRMEMRIADIDQTIADILTAIARKSFVII